MKLVLHIGTEKTGTTLLQNWLYHNQKSLSRQRVFLSDTLGKSNNREIVSYVQETFDDFTRRLNIKTPEDKAKHFEGFVERFRNEVNKAQKDHDVMVITSEHFHSRLRRQSELESLKKLLEGMFESITILCYFREQSEMRQSLYSTGLSGASSVPIEEFQIDVDASNYYYNFYDIASNWASVFGTDCLDFRIYDRNSFAEGDIRFDFLTAIPKEIDPSALSFEAVSSNESLSLLQGRAFRIINKNVPYWVEKGGVNQLNRFYKRIFNACKTLRVGKITDPRKGDLVGRFKESNEKFFSEFIRTKTGFPESRAGTGKQAPLSFSLEEVATMVEDITDGITSQIGSRVLLDSDAAVLRDIASGYETGRPLTNEEAIALMELAQRARPKGRIIRRKLKKWKTRRTVKENA